MVEETGCVQRECICTYCLAVMEAAEYFEQAYCHAACAEEEQKFKWQSTSTPWRNDE